LSDLAASDSWNPVLQATADVADLWIPGKGYLECRLVDLENSTCSVPVEVQDNRIGYVAIHSINDQEVYLLGFTDHLCNNKISLDQLRDITEIPLFLGHFKPTTQLRQWLEDLYQQDWQPPDALLNESQLMLTRWRKSAKTFQRVKLVEWKSQILIPPLALLVSISPENAETMNVHIQIHPVIQNQTTSTGVRFLGAASTLLPANLAVSLLTASGEVLKTVISRERPLDNCIQLPTFQSLNREEFTIKLEFNRQSFVEHFAI